MTRMNTNSMRSKQTGLLESQRRQQQDYPKTQAYLKALTKNKPIHSKLYWKMRVQIKDTTEQLMHCQETRMQNIKQFHITFMYRLNKEQQRLALWPELQDIAEQMQEAWCVICDFNAVLYKEDRIDKTIWSRIDRAFSNIHWYEQMNYTQVHYLANGLSDHTPLLIQFPSMSKPITQF
ncbi:hypothetical protein Cgig2_006675 [Carnegiea gigantea]|uniref:Endonuclease/exonuclease/phosphatase domain-containing protein n=1 Tax=Carnegiea gigantea TaxID=171969 RepID=A0A9Q1GQC1_9CARY|nr:hypothetical protein Cgig2_006675 [Carnegiea gigantea]